MHGKQTQAVAANGASAHQDFGHDEEEAKDVECNENTHRCQVEVHRRLQRMAVQTPQMTVQSTFIDRCELGGLKWAWPCHD